MKRVPLETREQCSFCRLIQARPRRQFRDPLSLRQRFVAGLSSTIMTVIDSLPLFPLSDVVLLPDSSVPLFIFEPRYSQMMREALEGAQQIGMVTVRSDSVESMAGDPPIFHVGCMGRIAHAQERPGGTFHILLVAEARFRILSEPSRTGERLYRSARVVLLEDQMPSSPREHELLGAGRDELVELLARFVRGLSGAVGDPERTLTSFKQLEPVSLVNAIAQSIPFRAIERQRILESDSLLDRIEITSDLLRFKLAEAGAVEIGTARLPN